MPKIVISALMAKAKAWTFEANAIGLEGPEAKAIKSWPRGQSLASRTTSLQYSRVYFKRGVQPKCGVQSEKCGVPRLKNVESNITFLLQEISYFEP